MSSKNRVCTFADMIASPRLRKLADECMARPQEQPAIEAPEQAFPRITSIVDLLPKTDAELQRLLTMSPLLPSTDHAGLLAAEIRQAEAELAAGATVH